MIYFIVFSENSLNSVAADSKWTSDESLLSMIISVNMHV